MSREDNNISSGRKSYMDSAMVVSSEKQAMSQKAASDHLFGPTETG